MKLGLQEKSKELAHILLNRYAKIFDPVTKPAANDAHRIQLTDSTPVRCAPYRISPQMEKVMWEEVMKILKRQNNKSNYASPALLVPKPDDTWRFCVEYTRLNLKTKSDNYPILKSHSRNYPEQRSSQRWMGITNFGKFLRMIRALRRQLSILHLVYLNLMFRQ